MDTFEIGYIDLREGFRPLCVFEGTLEQAVQVANHMDADERPLFWRKLDDKETV